MGHECHARGCTKEIPPRLFMCPRHWYTLDKPLQALVWKTYRQGQEIDKGASVTYCFVTEVCQVYVMLQEKHITVCPIGILRLLNKTKAKFLDLGAELDIVSECVVAFNRAFNL